MQAISFYKVKLQYKQRGGVMVTTETLDFTTREAAEASAKHILFMDDGNCIAAELTSFTREIIKL